MYKKLAKSFNAKKKIENHSEHVAASFTNDNVVAQDEDMDAAIQLTAGVKFHGRRQQSKGRVLSEHIPDWKLDC